MGASASFALTTLWVVSGLLDVGAGGSRLSVRVGCGCDEAQQGKTEQGEGVHVDRHEMISGNAGESWLQVTE